MSSTTPKRIKVLHVIAALERGGAERQLRIIVNNIDPHRYRSGVLYLDTGHKECDLVPEIDLIQVRRGRKIDIPGLWYRIYKAVIAYQPDIMHLWLPDIVTIPAAFAGKMSGARIVSAARGSMRFVNSIKQRMRNRARYLQHLFANIMVANFNLSNEPYIFRKLFSHKKGCVIPNAILVDTNKTANPPAFLNKGDSSFMIWNAGRIIPSKRLDILLDSFIMLRKNGLDISLVICGEGHPDLTDSLKQKIQQESMQEYITFLGDRQDWHFLARDADLFVLPSTAEGMPNVLFEAMLLGLPCIATDIPVIRNMLKHKENVWLVQAGSQSSLSDAIRQMYESDFQRSQLAKAGQRHAKSFSVEKMVSQYENIYDELLRT